MFFEMIRKRCGITEGINIYDEDIKSYIEDCRQDMKASGVPETLADSEEHASVLTAVTFYVKAHIGDDRSDTEKYMDLYRKKVFRLTLEGEE